MTNKFPAITLASWPAAIRMARAQRNEIREKIAKIITSRIAGLEARANLGARATESRGGSLYHETT